MIDIDEEINIDQIYYIFGDYVYNHIQPKITGDINMFKYIFGKIYLEYLFGSQNILQS